MSEPARSRVLLPRRDILKFAAAAAGAAALGPTLAACGSSTASSTTTQAGAGTPRRGGTLSAALAGGTSSDTLDAHAAVNTLDFGRLNQLYNCLVEYTPDGLLRLALAEEITPNANVTVWTIRLRQGVEFHNGKTLTADDIAYNFRRITNPSHPYTGASLIPKITDLRMLDAQTLRVSLASSFSPFYQMMAGYYFYIVPTGYDPKRPVGTGPFKYQSFTPGVESVFDRNPHYWEEGLPYIDSLVMQDYNDESGQVNALLGGSVQAIDQLSAASIATVTNGGGQIVVSNGGAYTPFTMRMDRPPFDDVRVRQAFRYMVDRPQLRETVFDGHGILGNDIFGVTDPDYDGSLPQREQDLPRAKALLKAAGKEGLTVTLVTAPVAQGAVQASEVLAQQATAIGVNIKIPPDHHHDSLWSELSSVAVLPGSLVWHLLPHWCRGESSPKCSAERDAQSHTAVRHP